RRRHTRWPRDWSSDVCSSRSILAIPARLAAQEQKYIVTDIGTLGGTFGEGNALNNKAWVVGDATLPGDTVRHAFLWRKGLMKNRSEERRVGKEGRKRERKEGE